ncbi:MAG: TlpA family protein disulfide reductase [Actinomycetota bacterium]|nr:TlpA family protein disulfide reductase [Actinomycetota bacterium]
MDVEPEYAGGSARRSRATKTIAILAAVVLTAVFAFSLARRGASPAGTDRDHLSVALTDFEGGRFTLETYRGRPMVVNFWASWCSSCAAEMPAFEQVHQRLGGSVEFLGVNHSDARSSAEELSHSTGVTYRLAEDPQGQLFSAFGGTGMPTTAFVAADGDIAEVVVGQLSEQQLTSLIREHLEVSS